MVENCHRLNAVVFRRTKADACRPDGSTLFARRWVHTESFVMSEAEREFYNELNVYLMDGFALARQQGNKGHASHAPSSPDRPYRAGRIDARRSIGHRRARCS